MNRDLPADRDKALAATAAGWGRTATAADGPTARAVGPSAGTAPRRTARSTARSR